MDCQHCFIGLSRQTSEWQLSIHRCQDPSSEIAGGHGTIADIIRLKLPPPTLSMEWIT